MNTAIGMIADERERQMLAEGYDAKHDDEHADGALALAAVCYASPVRLYVRDERAAAVRFNDPWPWEERFDKREYPDGGNVVDDNQNIDPVKRIRLLVKAGALIAAEIDRLQRAAERPAEGAKP